jgi:hypothetical protein
VFFGSLLPRLVLLLILTAIDWSHPYYIYHSPVLELWRDISEEATYVLKEKLGYFYPHHLLTIISTAKIADVGIMPMSFLASFPSLLRFVLTLVFLSSFLSRPLVMRPISLVWARIVESDKPVFTVIFGGATAFASAISEAAKHL